MAVERLADERLNGAARPAVPAGPYLVVGLGRAGRAAVRVLSARDGARSVRVWDDSRADEMRGLRRSLAEAGVVSETDAMTALRDVRTVIKSPGVRRDHPLLQAAAQLGLLVIDELELGWRLSARPVVAVTGTNGKSTTAGLLLSALRAGGGRPLLAGNTDAGLGCPMSALPPDHDGWVVAEVSSYQAEGSPEFLPSAAVLTNLTRDHLHRHGSMSAYAALKRRLFVRGDRAVALAILNADDRLGRRLAKDVSDRGGRAVTYGRARDADYRCESTASTIGSGDVAIDTPSGALRLRTRLPGAHNAANIAAALAAADALGCAREQTLDALATTAPLPGRFEPVDAGQPFDVVVDFAYTPDSVARSLIAARTIAATPQANVIAVLGGVTLAERRTREETGRNARENADHLVLCASSLKGEPPLIALAGILAGARSAAGGTLEVVLDRRAAIARGLSYAAAGDVVAILGRGPLQNMAHDTLSRRAHFDDRQVARELLEAGRA